MDPSEVDLGEDDVSDYIYDTEYIKDPKIGLVKAIEEGLALLA